MHEPENLANTKSLTYFQAPASYFWRWADRRKFVEWQNGTTICYQEELQAILHFLAPAGLPPLGAVLLVRAACADSWSGSAGLGLLHGLANHFGGGRGPEEELNALLARAARFMEVINALPRELRTDTRKLHLFRVVLQEPTPAVQAGVLGLVLGAQAAQGQRIVEDWTSGRLDASLQALAAPATRELYLNDLACLARALERFPITEALALRLRTGLDAVPGPLPALEPLEPELPDAPLDLLEQLTQDRRTAGLARLAQHLIAALRTPMHTKGASDQPLGGVSDVTNRGNFNRLLLSELAHDDLSLMARLVNNEALYLRREEPPPQEVRPRTVLLDSTLRMWGVPRVFALAAALAWARNSQHARQRVPVTAFALGGRLATPIDLASFDGVVAALSYLDPALHGGAALQEFGRTQATAAATDCLLITAAELLHQPDFATALAEAKTALRFLLAVTRGGEMQLYEYQNGHRVPLNRAQYDLDELLFAAPPRRPLRVAGPAEGPAFLRCAPAPLYFPVTRQWVSSKTAFYTAAIGAVSITDRRRVLFFWPNAHTGAQEMLPVIEWGSYYFGSNGTTHVYILVSGHQLLRVYVLTPATNEIEMVNLSAELKQSKELPQVLFKNHCFYIMQDGGTLVFDCQELVVKEYYNNIVNIKEYDCLQSDFDLIKPHINKGYNVLHRVNRMGVSGQGELVIEGQVVRLMSSSKSRDQGLYLWSRAPNDLPRIAQVNPETYMLTPNEHVHFRRFEWADGSAAVVDSRGLLHLRSADATVPEMTLLLILGRPTAAWAADGAVCGSAYFTGPNPARGLSVPEFYQQYFQRFIDHLT